jgi:hypothetical protein
MKTISNRTGVAEELDFLATWGKTFRQAFADNQLKPYLNAHYKTCVDAFQALSGKKSCFDTDLKTGLKRLEDYFLLLEKESKDDNDYKRAQFVAAIALLIEGKTISPQLTMALK